MPSKPQSPGNPITVIVEPNPSGHRLYYVRLLADGCHSKGRQVAILTTSVAVESAQWQVHLGDCAARVIIQPASTFTVSEIAKMSMEIGAEVTVLPEGDLYLLDVFRSGWKGSGELSLLIMRAHATPRGRMPWIAPVKTVVKQSLMLGSGLRQRVRISALRSPVVPRRGPLRWAADPVTLACSSSDARAMRERLDSEGRRYWIGVFGVITPRKNLPLIVEAIEGEPQIGLLIAGTLHEQVAEQVAPLLESFVAKGGRVVELPGMLTEVEFDSAIAAVDCVVCAHSNEGPSGVVLKGAALGKRLVLAGAKSLRQDAEFLSEQATWSPLNASSIRESVRHARRTPATDAKISLGAEGLVNALT